MMQTKEEQGAFINTSHATVNTVTVHFGQFWTVLDSTTSNDRQMLMSTNQKSFFFLRQEKSAEIYVKCHLLSRPLPVVSVLSTC